MTSELDRIAFGVLAGGASSRMGTDKAGLLLNGKTFLDTVLEAGSAFPERLVSFSAEAPDDGGALSSRGILTVRDERSGTGPLEGIRRILCKTSREACLITATDMPFLTAEFLAALASRWSGSGNLALTLGGRPEPLCSIYCRDCLPVIEALQRQERRRPALLFSELPTVFLPLEETGFSPDVLRNVNRPEEYAALTAPKEEKHER